MVEYWGIAPTLFVQGHFLLLHSYSGAYDVDYFFFQLVAIK